MTTLREGYDLAALRADAVAGLTVAIVALPLSMAIAIASGTTPDRGLYTAIVGGFLVSLLGGSRFQIGGPAGAFIVLMSSAVVRHGLDGAALATLMAGAFLMAAGFLRLGTYIKFIPYPVTVGFTAGIAVIIFASQVKDLLGLALAGKEPGDIVPKLGALVPALGTANPAAIGMAALSIGLIVGLKYLRPHWPGMLIAVAATALATWAFGLPIETIGSRFGGISASIPAPRLPTISLARLEEVLPDALAFALLGAIESLLSAVVADGMTGRRHRSNCELVAQGVANMGSALFGGICVTGAIARTATNVRAGGRSPVAGMLHSLFLLLFILLLSPLATYIPLAALAGVLVTVAWNMVEKHQFAALLRSSRGDAVVLLATFLLTVFRNLTEGIVVGFAIGAVLFIHRMAGAAGIEAHVPHVRQDKADDAEARTPYDPQLATDSDVVVYRLSGAFFFGTASAMGAVLDSIADRRKAFVIDFAAVPFVEFDGGQRHGVACPQGGPRRRAALHYRHWRDCPARPPCRRRPRSAGDISANVGRCRRRGTRGVSARLGNAMVGGAMTASTPLKLLLSAVALRTWGSRIETEVLPGSLVFVTAEEALAAQGPCDVEVAFMTREVTGKSSSGNPTPELQGFDQVVRKSPRLKWLQIHPAGAERPIYRELRDRGVKVTTASGATAVTVAHSVLGALIALNRRFPLLADAQRRHAWEPRLGERSPRDLKGQRAVIVGMGPIGRTVAGLLQMLGMVSVGVRRTAEASAPFEQVISYERLPEVLPRADWLILCCPASPLTRGLANASGVRGDARGLAFHQRLARRDRGAAATSSRPCSRAISPAPISTSSSASRSIPPRRCGTCPTC